MRRWLAAIAFAVCCMLPLAGCDGVQEPGDGVGGGPNETADTEIVITVGEIKEGAQVSSVPVEVAIYGEPVECRTEWVIYSTDSYAKGHSWGSWQDISKTHHQRHCSACGASETAECTFSGVSCTGCGQVVIN